MMERTYLVGFELPDRFGGQELEVAINKIIDDTDCYARDLEFILVDTDSYDKVVRLKKLATGDIKVKISKDDIHTLIDVE